MNRFEFPEGSSDLEPLPELTDRLDEKVVRLPCYEPAGLQVELTGRILCNHSLLLGQTGSGKTSILRWFIKNLIQHEAQDSELKPAVFIFDLNADETVALVQKWAREVGREDDVKILAASEGHLDLLANIRSFEELPFASAQFMHGLWTHDDHNAYWGDTARSLIDAALAICFVVKGKLEFDEVIRFLTNWLIAGQPNEEDQILLQYFTAICAQAPEFLDKILLSKLDHVSATVQMWSKLDHKTKGILQSCLIDALGPLVSLETRKYLDASRGACFIPEELVEGKIMVFSLPAGKYLEAASLLGKIIKSRLYVALQDRPQNRNQRLCAIIADEYHYLATGGKGRSSDVTALATLRSRNVGLIAATQSLDHLASVMGSHDFRSLIPNFGNHFFFRSTEATTGTFATSIMGMLLRESSPAEDLGNLLVGVPQGPTWDYVCPPGTLARLQVCQAYIVTSGGFRSPGPIWLGGNHETLQSYASKEPDLRPVDPFIEIREQIKSKVLVEPFDDPPNM